MKRVKILAAALSFMLICGSIIGCGNGDSADGDRKQEKTSVYSVKIGDNLYSVDEELTAEMSAFLMETCEVEFAEAESIFPASNFYKNRDFAIRTWINEADNGENSETIYFISTGTGSTERGISVGNTLKEVRAAYPELAFISGSCTDDNGEFMNNTRRYRFYDDGDDTNNYLDFWLARIEGEESADGSEWAVTGIETADALDMSREQDIETGKVFGDDRIHMEMPDGLTTRIFRENADGSETEIKSFAGAASGADLDSDGVDELICHVNDSGYRNIVIIDIVNGDIIETDVNSELGCTWSDYAGLIGNIKSEYRNCIEAAFDGGDGRASSYLYDYADGMLEQRCGLDEALGV